MYNTVITLPPSFLYLGNFSNLSLILGKSQHVLTEIPGGTNVSAAPFKENTNMGGRNHFPEFLRGCDEEHRLEEDSRVPNHEKPLNGR